MSISGKKLRRRVKFARSLFEKLEDRQLLSTTLTVGSGQTYTTIQSAVNAASAGDTILVNPGTYTEQVTIPSNLTGLTLIANVPSVAPTATSVPAGSTPAQINALFPTNGGAPTIVAPASLSGNMAIVDDAASNVTIRGFNIQGPSTGVSAGILVEGGATSVQVKYNYLRHVHDAPSTSGNQTGYGIEVNGGSSAVIDENFVSDYQKNGIVVSGSGSIGTVTNNVVVGDGPTAVINQNGIVFESAAAGSISSNLVTGDVYTPQTSEDGGILLFNSGQVAVSFNTAYNNDGNIILDGPSTSPAAQPGNYSDYAHGSSVIGNTAYGATFDGISLFDGANSVTIGNNNSHNNGDDGLLIDDTSFGNRVSNNTFSSNGAYDIEDDTYGQSNPVSGDNGTANFYNGNTFSTSNFPVTGQSVTIFSPTSAPPANQQNVFDPQIASSGGVDVGIKFTSDVSGTVAGVRFFKSSQDTGVHQGELWSSTGTLLASVTFTGESASGWQQANFSSPVLINANTTYIIAYHSTTGFITYTQGGLTNSIDNPPLHALASGASGGDGVFHYDATPGNVVFPNQYNGQSPNYWVDVVFTPSSSSTTDTVFSPTSGPAAGEQNVFDPKISSAGGVELGAKFTSTVSGLVDGVRFYKSSSDTGVHTGELWSSTGTLLASVTFTGESGSGWQQANFSTPVQINANTTYIIAYHSTTGFISYTQGGMTSGFTNGPLSELPSSTTTGGSTGNDVFHYDVTPGTPSFPTTFNGQSPNYWVDVVFTPSTVSPPPPATFTIFSPSSAPASSDQNVVDFQIASAGGVDLGTKFTASETGVVSGVQFYKGSQDTGVHVGELWSGDGVLLATATFTAESPSGWQQVNFSTPITLAANTTYIIAYHTTSDSIAYTQNGLASAINNGPLTALASSTTTGGSTGNGVYNYDSNPGTPRFPSTFNGQSPNYWVDLSFIPTT